jgi:hypothetical protein
MGSYEYDTDGNGNLLYEKRGDNGSMEGPTTEDTGEPIMKWNGLYNEGILWTFVDLFHGNTFGDTFSERWRNSLKDPAKRKNMILALGDAIAYSLLFGLAAVLREAYKEDKSNYGAYYMAYVANSTGNNFMLPVNMESLVNFNFNALSTYVKAVKGLKSLTFGNESLGTWTVNNFGAAKIAKPIINNSNQ